MVYKLGTHVDFCGYRNIHLSVCVPEPCLALRRTELHSRAEWRLEIRGVEAIREEAWEPIGRREREHAIAKIRGKIGVVENFETLLSIRECGKIHVRLPIVLCRRSFFGVPGGHRSSVSARNREGSPTTATVQSACRHIDHPVPRVRGGG